MQNECNAPMGQGRLNVRTELEQLAEDFTHQGTQLLKRAESIKAFAASLTTEQAGYGCQEEEALHQLIRYARTSPRW